MAEPLPTVIATVVSIEEGDEDAFVFRYLSDLAPLGIFVPQPDPLELGTAVEVSVGPMTLPGVVVWRNPAGSETPGVGVRLTDIEEEQVDELLSHVRAMAYLPDDPDA
mgnify:FL=1